MTEQTMWQRAADRARLLQGQSHVFASFLDSILDRPVANDTMLKGLFDVRLEFSREGTMPPVDSALLNADPPRAASIFTALQEQLGLRLESGEATAEVIVIESIDRPSPN